MNLIASVLHLTRADIKALKITDPYSLHRVVYSLYADTRSEDEKNASKASGILYADQGGDFQHRKILLLADREPAAQIDGQYGEVQSKTVSPDFLQHKRYRFKVIVNPTRRDNASRKLIPVKGREAIAEWFLERSESSWGFEASSEHLQVDNVQVMQFKDKAQRKITLSQAQIQGILKVTDRDRFIQSFRQGIGRGRAFGCGLLQIAPITESLFN